MRVEGNAMIVTGGQSDATGAAEALYAVYHKKCEKVMGEMIARGEFSPQEMLKELRAYIVPKKDVNIICGKMNALYRLETPEDIVDLENMLEEEGH